MSYFPEDIKITADLIMDRSAVIYGPSGSGKSKIIVDIMAALNPHVDQIIVISPTDAQNGTYSKNDVVPTPLIHYKLDDKLLETIWKRQEMLSAVYASANKVTVLSSLFNRLNLRSVKDILEKAEIAKSAKIKETYEQYADQSRARKIVEDIGKEYDKFFLLLYKRYISEHRDSLAKMDLDPDEAFTLRYLDFNPRLLLIFDDCTADFKRLKSPLAKSVMGKLFFQNRWNFITVVIACHGDKNLDADLRTNAFMSIWTTENSANVFFAHEANGFPKEIGKRVVQWSTQVFKGFQKLIYVREHDKFYKYTAESHDGVKFGSAAVRSFCKKIKADGISMDSNNAFYQYFH
jgi:energy-coupling factor transporter ATP-binding protein EcfA2